MPDTAEYIQINETRILVRRRRRQRHLRLNVYPDGRIIASAGRAVSLRALTRFVMDRWDWVEKTQLKFREGGDQFRPTHQFVNGESFLLLGKEYGLRIIPREVTGVTVQILEPDILVEVPVGRMDAEYTRARVRQALVKFYKTNGHLLLQQRYAVQTARTGLCGAKLVIRGPKTRWGSCSRDHTISLNWKLLFAPVDVMDYVIVHELAHLVEFNHSKKFWLVVERFCPDYRRQRQWLKDHELRMSQF